MSENVAAVVIGRNEGPRLIAALRSVKTSVSRVVYVDSGSTDNSIEEARNAGAKVVMLDPQLPFSAGRARNEGVAALGQSMPRYIQFMDGDCMLDADWIRTATKFLSENSNVAVVCGRRRELHPEASVWNGLCDAEWDTPVGRTKACGGDALVRTSAFFEVGGFNSELIAGEEPELCFRLRAAGWAIWRVDAEMTRHDAAMMRFSQWWNRMRRGGYAFAEGSALHGANPERHFVREAQRALLWGLGIPFLAVLGTLLINSWWLTVFLAWPAQVIRLCPQLGFTRSLFLTIGKVPEAIGVLEYWFSRLLGAKRKIIEYK